MAGWSGSPVTSLHLSELMPRCISFVMSFKVMTVLNAKLKSKDSILAFGVFVV